MGNRFIEKIRKARETMSQYIKDLMCLKTSDIIYYQSVVKCLY